MALELDIPYRGITISAAYVRLERFVFTSKTDCRAYVTVYARQGEMEPILDAGPQVVDFVYDFNSPVSLHGQAYAALRAQQKAFSKAKDV